MTASRYTLVNVLFHWVLAMLILMMTALGYFMADLPRKTPERAFCVNLHKSLGLVTLLLIPTAIAVRTKYPPPPLPPTIPQWERRAAGLGQRLLWLCILGESISGYLTSAFGPYGIKFSGVPVPYWGWNDPTVRGLASDIHRSTAAILLAMIALHVLAAIKHLILDRDALLHRMLPNRRTSKNQHHSDR